MNINKIATLAATVKKPSKKLAFDLVRGLAEGKFKLSEHLLAELYSYFASPPVKKPKTAFEWVALAVANKRDVRGYLQFVYVTKGRMVATDGYRLHIAPTKLKSGYYNVQGDRVAVDHKFPDFDRLLKEHRSKQSLMPATIEIKVVTGIEHFGFPFLPKIYFPKSQVEDVLSYMNDPTIHYSSVAKSKGSAVLFKQDDLQALVMPIRGY